MTARSFTDETAARASGNLPGAGPPPVRRRVVVWLVLYGLLLFEIAVAAVMYNPVNGQFGFNPAAKTALISGGVCGGLSLLWAFLLWRGARWPLIGAVMSLQYRHRHRQLRPLAAHGLNCARHQG